MVMVCSNHHFFSFSYKITDVMNSDPQQILEAPQIFMEAPQQILEALKFHKEPVF